MKTIENRTWHIYTLGDPRTGLVRYVGVTFYIKRRLAEHLSRARKGGRTHRDCWVQSLLSLGLRPVLTVIETGLGAGWQVTEQNQIAKHRLTCSLTNQTDGGGGIVGFVPSPETRAKWSAMRKGVKYAPGRSGGMLGKKHTPEAVEKIRASGKGRKHTPESKAKLSAAHMGKKLSDAQKELIRRIHLGSKHTPEHKAKIAAATTNRKRVMCVETGETFESITAAAKSLGVVEPSVVQSIRKGCRCKGYHFRLA